MWVAASQGFDLCPRLKNLAERRLTLPKGARVPESLKAVVDKALYMECVKDQWDDLLRVAASISNGTVSAVLVLQRFGSAAQGDRLYRAAKTLGRLLRTIYLCDYFTKPEFRREIHRVLNRGESVHTLQRAIHFGEVPQERGRRSEEMIAISGSLSLLTNLVIGWTASKMQTAATILSAQGTVISPEVWRPSGSPCECEFSRDVQIRPGEIRSTLAGGGQRQCGARSGGLENRGCTHDGNREFSVLPTHIERNFGAKQSPLMSNYKCLNVLRKNQ